MVLLLQIMGTAPEPSSPPFASPRLRRQRSVASSIASRCCGAFCCSECDNFFTQLPAPPSSASRDLAGNPNLQPHHQRHHSWGWHDSWRLLGSRRSRVSVPCQDETEAMPGDDVYTKPGRWRLFLRKLRAETRKMNCSKPEPAGFHYDALSYAMNFDEGPWQHQQNTFYRSPPAFIESLPPQPSASSVLSV